MKAKWYGMTEWLPAAGAMCLVCVAVGYALMRRGEVAEGIRRMSELGATLTTTADAAVVGVRTPEEIEQLQARARDLQLRFEDSRRAGVVVSQLSEAARAAGLNLLAIEPMPSAPNAAAATKNLYPKYRVSVAGHYRDIASYLSGCTRQRIPARVVEFRIEPCAAGTIGAADELAAVVQVEAFCPDADAAKEST